MQLHIQVYRIFVQQYDFSHEFHFDFIPFSFYVEYLMSKTAYSRMYIRL